MDSVLRAAVVYLILMLIFRVLGKRSLAQVTMLDFVILLVVSEATQQALLGNDFSITNGALVIMTLLMLSRFLDIASAASPKLGRFLNDVPLVLIDDGELKKDRLRQSRVDESEIMEQARMQQGVERLDQIKYAVLERSGGISVIPK